MVVANSPRPEGRGLVVQGRWWPRGYLRAEAAQMLNRNAVGRHRLWVEGLPSVRWAERSMMASASRTTLETIRTPSPRSEGRREPPGAPQHHAREGEEGTERPRGGGRRRPASPPRRAGPPCPGSTRAQQGNRPHTGGHRRKTRGPHRAPRKRGGRIVFIRRDLSANI
jgi:hypothetical protein